MFRRAGGSAAATPRVRKPRWRRITVRVLLGAGVLLFAAGAWLAVRGALAVGEASALRAAADRFEATLDAASSDAAHAASFLDRVSGDAGALAGHASTLASLTSDPVWLVAEHVPYAGAQLRAARVGAGELARLTAAGRDVLDASSGVLASAKPRGVDVDAVRALVVPLDRAVAAIGGARGALSDVDRTQLVGPVASALRLLDDMIQRVGPALEAMQATAAVVPPMLGADAPRTVLLMLQNPAELRAAGGITGTFIALRADDGVVQLIDQADSAAFPPADEPMAAIPADASARADDGIGRFVQNITATPDFALSAELARSWWRQARGEEVDAVVAIDPLVLEPLLNVTGPVSVEGDELRAEQVVDTLLRRPYLEREHDAQSAYFRAVTEAVFTAALARPAEVPGMAFHLAPLADQGRLAVWSAHPAEQAVIARTSVAGLAARMDQQDAHALLFDDLTGGKLDAYLDASLSLVAECRPDRRVSIMLRAELRSEVEPGVELPWRAFPAFGGFAREDIGLRLTALALPGAVAEGAWIDGAPAAWSAATVVGRPGAAVRVTLPPGASATVEFRFAGEPGATPALLHTPLVGEAPVAVTGGGCG
ncbi:DUF4012 domain-containing protein [Microbacterium sp. JZ31]|uniref:DUF4012 domain-containing protein n=1 Tax=Microbacterium sp. JZ31 TaxID=1906274 RepID=UPI001934AA8F|nr:DUF4012 domain-containing protein [Microbacterium sp. JZ31]